MAEAVVAALLAVWLAATVGTAVEGSRLSRRVRRSDVFRLVPGWSLFAPVPATFDFRLLARARRPDGELSPFREVGTPPLGWRRAIWYPEKRLRKTIFDCGYDLAVLDERGRAGSEYTIAYLTLLTLAGSSAGGAGAEAVQFLLVRTDSYSEGPELLVRSRFHPVAGE